MNRWIAISVSMTGHTVLSGGEFDRRSAFLWLIANAAWKDHQVRSRAGIITLRRGEVIASRGHLASVWQWSEKRVRTFMSELADCKMIEMGQRTGQYANIAKICNYDKYQGVTGVDGKHRASERPAQGPTEGQPEASEGPHSTKNTNTTTTHTLTQAVCEDWRCALAEIEACEPAVSAFIIQLAGTLSPPKGVNVVAYVKDLEAACGAVDQAALDAVTVELKRERIHGRLPTVAKISGQLAAHVSKPSARRVIVATPARSRLVMEIGSDGFNRWLAVLPPELRADALAAKLIEATSYWPDLGELLTPRPATHQAVETRQ
jgi:hypothetical protein